MLTDPFSGNLQTIKATARFLLDQLDRKEYLWSESFEDRWGNPRPYSIWASADILGALTDVAELAVQHDDQELLELHAEFTEVAPKVTESLLGIGRRLEKRADEERTKGLHYLEESEGRTKDFTENLREFLRRAQGYRGFPRTKAGAKGEPGFPNTLATCAVQKALRKVDAFFGDGFSKLPDDLRSRQKELALALANPDLGILRQALDRIQRDPRTDGGLWQQLRKHCKEISECWNGRQNPNPLPNDVTKNYSFHLRKLLERTTSRTEEDRGVGSGLLWVDADSRFGWSAVPFQPGGGVDFLSTISVVEVLVAAAVREAPDGRAAYVDAIEAAQPFVDDYFRRVIGAGGVDEYWARFRIDPALSSRFSLGELTRVVLWVTAALLSIDKMRTETDARLAGIRGWLGSMREVMYTALVLRVFRIVVEERSDPFEALPASIITGNDVSHWPGIDVGLVALALLRGRSDYDWMKASEDFVELRPIKDQVFASVLSDELPPEFPLFTACVDAIRRRIVGPQAMEVLHGKLPGNIREKAKSKELLGAFISSISLATSHSAIGIYLWSTAHALRVLVEWERETGDTSRERRRLAAKAKKFREKAKAIDGQQRMLSSRPPGWQWVANAFAFVSPWVVLIDRFDKWALGVILTCTTLWFLFLFHRLGLRVWEAFVYLKKTEKLGLATCVLLRHLCPALAFPLYPTAIMLLGGFVGPIWGTIPVIAVWIAWFPVVAFSVNVLTKVAARHEDMPDMKEDFAFTLTFMFGEGPGVLSTAHLAKYRSRFKK